MQAALRLFLRFAAEEGWASPELVHAVPSFRTYGLSGVPRGLAETDVWRLLHSLGSSDVSARDRAIVLLLAVYGVRRGQVCALRFEDLDWRERSITFRAHKGGKAIRHELIPPVADALATYLRHERPVRDDASVFLSTMQPHGALNPTAVTQVIRSLLDRLGIRSTPLGPHALRHAFATRLLRAGQSLKAIADLLGHRSLSATSMYAKVDHARLLEVAGDWPEVLS
jgi:integrase